MLLRHAIVFGDKTPDWLNKFSADSVCHEKTKVYAHLDLPKPDT